MSDWSGTTVINLSIGEYSGDDFRWKSKDRRMYAISFRCNEEIQYKLLVERICKKIGVDISMTNLKLSYIPVLVNDSLPIDIVDDEDLIGYISVVDKRLCRNALRVEVVENGGNSSFGVNYGVTGSAVIVEAGPGEGDEENVGGEQRDDVCVEVSVGNECADTAVRGVDSADTAVAESGAIVEYETVESGTRCIHVRGRVAGTVVRAAHSA